MPWIADKCLVPNVKIFVKLPPNSGYFKITDKFYNNGQWPVGVLYSEVSLISGSTAMNIADEI